MSLVPVRASAWVSYASGQLLGITDSTTAGVTTRYAQVYTLATGAAQQYTLPSDESSMGGSWMLPIGGTTPAYNFVTGASVAVTSPSSAGIASGPFASLSPTGAVLWQAQTTAGHSVFASSSSPSAAPSAWTTIDGLLTGFWGSSWIATGSELQYVLDIGTSIQFCRKALLNLAAAATCATAWSGSTSSYDEILPHLYNFGTSTVVDVEWNTSTTSEVRDYVWSGSTVAPIQVPSGSIVPMSTAGWMPTGDGPYYGDSPYVLVRDANGVPTVANVKVDGSLGAAITLPTSVLRPDFLAVASDRLVGADNRDGSNGDFWNLAVFDHFTAWSRTVSGAGIGTETVLPRRASGMLASSGRTLVSGKDGLSVYDKGQLSYTFADATMNQLSGPYVEQTHYANGNPTSVISRVDGSQVATFPLEGVLFGSRFVTYSDVTNGLIHVVVNDLTGNAPAHSVDLAVGDSYCTGGLQVWNDYAAASCTTSGVGDVVTVFNLATGAVVKTVTGKFLENLNDGFITVGGYDSVTDTTAYEVQPISGGSAVALSDCIQGVQSDGVGQLVCSSDTQMIWRDYSSLSTSAGRVLGWLAPTTFASGTWTPQIDGTKAFSAGVLRISQGSTVVRDLVVPASVDGSVRGVSWDGKNTAGVVVPSGSYTATLVVAGKDESGPVVAVDGTSAPTFTVAWTGGAVVVPGAPGSFVALTPARLLDTRVGSGGAGPLAAAGSVDLQVTGRGGVPTDGVGAVILNVTAVTPTAPGYLTVYPTGTTAPNASNLNFTAGQVVPNLVLAKVGTNGKVTIRNGSGGKTEVVADVAGYFVSGTVVDPGGVTSVAPSRLLDTRVALGGTGPVASNGTVKVQVTGRGGVPATGVSAVVVNLTAVTPTGAGYLTAYPSGGTAPLASNVNFVPGQVVPNLAFVKLGADGSFTIRNGSAGVTEVIADVAGYVMDGTVTGSGMFVALTPARILDTRNSSAVGASAVKTLTVAGAGGVPATGISGVVLNVTVVAGGSPGYLTVYPADVAAPLASNLNFIPGQVVPNLVAVKTSAAGAVAIRNASGSPNQVIADVAGYFTA
jgi:hypothetical protein